MTNKLSVLVTGVGGGGHGHEIVKALRLADRYRLIGVDVASSSFGLFEVDEAHLVPPASDTAYIDTLIDICQRRDCPVLIHGSEPELKVISKNRERLKAAGILPLINTQQVIDTGMDKSATMTFLQEHGFTLPRSVLVKTDTDMPADFPLPAVVKPSVGGGGSNNTFLVQQRDELVFACQYIMRQEQAVLLQEYVGTPQDEYTVGVLHTLYGKLVGSIAVRRYIMSGLSNRIKVPNRTGRTELSPMLAISSGVSQGYIDHFPEVRRACEAIANALESRGPLNIQCRFVDGQLYPFEINPRFSGTTYIRALVGFNEPDLLIRHHVLNETLPDSVCYKFGQIVRGLQERYIVQPSPVKLWQR